MQLATITLTDTTTQEIEVTSNVGSVFCVLTISTTGMLYLNDYCIRPKLIKSTDYYNNIISKTYINNRFDRLSDTVYDYVKKEGTEWKLHYNTDWSLLNYSTAIPRISLGDSTQTNTIGFDFGYPLAQNSICICNYFKTLTSIDDTEGIIAISVGEPRFRIYINRSRLTTQNSTGFLNWLNTGSKQIRTLYQLATPYTADYSSGKLEIKTFDNSPATISTTSYAQPKFTLQEIGLVGQKVNKSSIVNNLTTTNTEMVFSAPMGKQLKSEIDTINTNLTTQSGTITMLNGWTNNASFFKLTKQGNRVDFRGLFGPGTTTIYTAIMTIPSGFRPNAMVVLPMNSYSNFNGVAWLNTLGNVEINGADLAPSTTVAWYVINATWYIV